MRFFVILAVLVLLALVAMLLYYGITGRTRVRRPAQASRWEVHTESDGGVTTVVVRRTFASSEPGRQVVAEIPDDDPDWETRYHDAMAQARSRVAALESETD